MTSLTDRPCSYNNGWSGSLSFQFCDLVGNEPHFSICPTCQTGCGGGNCNKCCEGEEECLNYLPVNLGTPLAAVQSAIPTSCGAVASTQLYHTYPTGVVGASPVSYSSVAPTQVSYSSAVPTQVSYASAVPTQVSYASAVPTQVSYASAVPTQIQVGSSPVAYSSAVPTQIQVGSSPVYTSSVANGLSVTIPSEAQVYGALQGNPNVALSRYTQAPAQLVTESLALPAYTTSSVQLSAPTQFVQQVPQMTQQFSQQVPQTNQNVSTSAPQQQSSRITSIKPITVSQALGSNTCSGNEIPQFAGNYTTQFGAVSGINAGDIVGSNLQPYPFYGATNTPCTPSQVKAVNRTLVNAKQKGVYQTSYGTQLQPVYADGHPAPPPAVAFGSQYHGAHKYTSANGVGRAVVTPTVALPKTLNGNYGETITETYMESLARNCCGGLPQCIPEYIFIILRGPSRKGTFNYDLQTSEIGEFYGQALWVNGISGNTIYMLAGHRYYFGYYKKSCNFDIDNQCCQDDELALAINFKHTPKTTIRLYAPFDFCIPCGGVQWLRIPNTWHKNNIYLSSVLYVGCAVPVEIQNSYTMHL